MTLAPVFRKRLDAALLAVALVNIAAGIALSFLKGGFSDLFTLAGWSREWLHGGNPYGPHSATDYPPWALVELSPLAAVPTDALPALWVVVNIALALFIASRLAERSGERDPFRRRLTLLILGAACLRSFGQFSHLSYALALAGAFSSSTLGGGVLIGVSLMKPQIGGAALLAAIAARQWRRAAIAVAVPTSLSALFALRASVNPDDLVRRYVEILVSIQGSPDTLPGHSDLRAWLWAWWPGADVNAMLTLLLWIALLMPAVVLAARRRDFTSDERLELLALCGAMSLLALRHLSYDFILLLPAIAAWRCPPFSREWHARAVLFWMLSALLVIAIPSWVRLALDFGLPPAFGTLTQIDRVMCLAVWVTLTWRLVWSAPPATTGVLSQP